MNVQLNFRWDDYIRSQQRMWNNKVLGLHLLPPTNDTFTRMDLGEMLGAGWAAVLFRHVVTRFVIPDYILFGPVVTHCWDPNFLAAERGTNNTGELTAIGEACLWLLDRSEERSGDPDDPQSLAVVPAYIYQ